MLTALLLFCLFIVSVKADTYSGKIKKGNLINNIYVKKSLPDGSGYYLYEQASFINRSLDNQFVYCLQPYVFVDGNAEYQVQYSDYLQVIEMTPEQWERVSLLAYYGYKYGNHTEDKWYAVTQLLIWKAVSPNTEIFFTDTLAGNRNDNLYINEINELNSLVANHSDRPSFNTTSLSLNIGQTISLNDSNGVLSNYKVASTNNVDASISGNSLSITATGVGSASVTLEKCDILYSTPPIVYYSPFSQDVLAVGQYDPIFTTIEFNTLGGKVAINKIDSETKLSIPQGQATLEGAVYGIYKEDGTYVSQIVTDKTGYAKSDYLPSTGRFYLQEISRSTGYLLDNTRYYFTIDDNNLEPTINVKEQVVKNYISILKQYDYVDGNTTFLNAESGIEFEIYYPDGRLFDTIKTDKNGYASINLPYGVWKFHQVNSTAGYEKIQDFHITVDYDSSNEQYYNILNNSISAYLQIIKRDVETGKTIALANTTFKIFNKDKNQYVSQYVGGKIYSEFTTDETGKSITYLKLESGDYKLVEIKSPYGYLLDSDGIDFTIGEDTYYNYTTYGTFVTIYYDNKPIKGQVEINKSGEKFVIEDNSYKYEKVPLEEIEFELYAKEDILSSDKQIIYYKAGTLVDTLVTDETGYVISKPLPLGNYCLIEKRTKDGYVIDTEEHCFTISAIDDKTEIVYMNLNLFNYLKKGTIELTKTDLVTGETISNTTIEIYTENDDLIFTGITDENGIIVIDDLPVGKYYLKESRPADGYLITDEIVYFEIKENGEIIKANLKNEKIKVPDTGISDSKILNYVAFVLIVSGVGYIIYEDKKKKK